ncbi:hypothetical protein DYB32_003832 [Aphanomyces invadans]|uniref:Uncharacterized protein n=1 Tax=Aphanomyces invadans TaxID=157072 RepID=A0A3R6Z0H2_9STRA|nr:hypothetical protein DYB32_003832 [Aphanomyces invadans]
MVRCDAQDAIAQCCEALWISHASGAEAVIPQLIPYLVVQALDGESATAIKRLRDVLDALSLLDFEDTSSRYEHFFHLRILACHDKSARLLKDLLLRCFVSPAFLKTNDGVAILSDLFHLDASFMDDIHEIIRKQVHCQKVSVVKRYGLVYFKLPSLLKLEEDCIQPYLYHAIYIQTPALCTKLHAVLHAFFDAKQVCDPMLHRLVEPILWRGLRATNDQVRKQAALVLFQGFPYQNPSATKEEADALMQKQVDVMLQLVQDTSPATRVVLSLYWEVIPHDSIQQFLFWLFELVQDASSTPVRVAVLQGLPLVLDNHLSHSVLKSLLPKARPSATLIAGMWHIIALLPYQKDAFVLRALDVMAKFECSSNKLLLAGILQCMVQWGEQLTLIESLMDQLHLRRSARANVALLLVDQRLALVPILCEAMFFALQSATAVEFMQRVIEFAVDEPALNVQLLSMVRRSSHASVCQFAGNSLFFLARGH